MEIKRILENYPEGLPAKDIAAILMRNVTDVKKFLSQHKEDFHPTSRCNKDAVWKLGPEPEQLINLPPNSVFDYASRM